MISVRMKRLLAFFVSAATLLNVLPLFAAASDDTENDALAQEIKRYNHVLGTNAFAPGYQFTDADPISEVADQILAWGSNMIKFSAGSNAGLIDRVLEGRDFDYVFVWYRSNGHFHDGYSEAEARADYDAFYSTTQKLLQTYNETGKQFFLGHWEGDWYYLDGYDKTREKVDDTATEGMIAWMNNRQKAVDDAKRDTPHSNVYVWNYMELNRPVDAMKKGYDRVVNRVLPFTNVDYVSYSAYDSKDETTRTIKRVIAYINQNLPEKSGVPEPRVFIGEVAEPASQFDFNDSRHCNANLRILTKYLQCGVRFVLYWEMYCNETLPDGRPSGFWLIDSEGNKTQLYRKLQRVLRDGQQYVEEYAEKNGKVPSDREYRDHLLRHPVILKARIGVFFENVWIRIRSLFVR